MKNLLWLFLAIGSFAVINEGCGGSASPESVKAETVEPSALKISKIVAVGRVEPERRIAALSVDVAGIVQRIEKQAGDAVKKGEPILELQNDLERARVRLSQTKVATQVEEIRMIQALLKSAMLKAENLKQKYERVKNLAASGAETQQKLDDAKTDYDAAAVDVKRLEASLASEQKRLNEFSADAKISSVEAERRIVKAPLDGRVLSMDLSLGESVQSGDKVADFAPTGDVTALAEIDELFASRVKLGQKAFVRTQGGSDTLAVGEVMFVAPYLKKKSLFSDDSANLEDRRVREVRIRLLNAEKLLLNSRVECVILIND